MEIRDIPVRQIVPNPNNPREACEGIEELAESIARFGLWVPLTVVEDGDAFRLIDGGAPFDPLAKEDPDLTLSLEERPIGGLGVYMARQCMDEMTYRREDGKNVTTVRKEWVSE